MFCAYPQAFAFLFHFVSWWVMEMRESERLAPHQLTLNLGPLLHVFSLLQFKLCLSLC